MDPVLMVVLVAIGIFGTPVVLKQATAAIISNYAKNRESDKIVKAQKASRESNNEIEIAADIRRIQTVVFRNVRTNAVEKVKVSEDAEFNEGEELLLKGKLHIVAPDGKKTIQDIYLFQPRVFSATSQIGPKIDKKGNLSDEYSYLCKKKDTGEILTGYLPKREIFSGMRYDFVKDSKHDFISRNPEFTSLSNDDKKKAEILEKYIYIDIPKAPDGSYIPVDLSNPDELKAFRNYILGHKKRHEKTGKSPGEYFQEQLDIAQSSMIKHIKTIDPVYVEKTKKIKETKDETVQVESSRQAKRSIDEYYQRYNYYLNPILGERYNTYNGAYGHPSPPPHDHGHDDGHHHHR